MEIEMLQQKPSGNFSAMVKGSASPKKVDTITGLEFRFRDDVEEIRFAGDKYEEGFRHYAIKQQ